MRLAEELRAGEKNRAENLMIADLLRNDLGVVCEIGTVHVPHLMDVETYETVHQLVSTVRGLLREERRAARLHPRLLPRRLDDRRAEEAHDGDHRRARGRGARRLLRARSATSASSGGCDLNIVIRTIVIDGDSTTLGVGGAIVMQSDAEDEYQEMLLKARAPMQAIDPSVDPQAVFEPGPSSAAAG